MSLESIMQITPEQWLAAGGFLAACYVSGRALRRVGGILLRWVAKPRPKTETEKLAEQAVKYLKENAIWWMLVDYGWRAVRQSRSELAVKVRGYHVRIKNAKCEVEVPYKRGGKAVLRAFWDLQKEIKGWHVQEVALDLKKHLAPKECPKGGCSCCKEDSCA